MRKVIAGLNMTLDGFCDHTVAIADDEIHDHYTELLKSAGTLIYGRVTYQLMESFWPGLVRNPSGDRDLDEFAVAIDKILKIVFSNTLKKVEWNTARIAEKSIEKEVSELKKQSGGDILVGSPSLIVQTTNLGLVDEFQIAIQPIIIGKGLPLFKNITDRVDLKLVNIKKFTCGVVVMYYEVVRN